MNLYRLEYTIVLPVSSQPQHTKVIAEFFEAVDDAAAITEANSRFPGGATNKKLHRIGINVALG